VPQVATKDNQERQLTNGSVQSPLVFKIVHLFLEVSCLGIIVGHVMMF